MDFLDFLDAGEQAPEPWPEAVSLDALLRLPVGPQGEVWAGHLPAPLMVERDAFEALWDLHPPQFNRFGRFADKEVYLPRWQQAYNIDYAFSDTVSKAATLPPELEPYLAWAQSLDPRYNGVLLNWYDDEKGHYIGRHRDSEVGIDTEVPILTVSLGGTRKFRVRPFRGQGFVDLDVTHGAVVVVPWSTNMRYTHEVPPSERYRGRRISITVRAFKTFGDLSEVLEQLGD